MNFVARLKVPPIHFVPLQCGMYCMANIEHASVQYCVCMCGK